jgi:hypothetical protein
MAYTFFGIPIRKNGEDVEAGWWNILRLAGIAIESFLGAYIGETSFTIANAQGSAADVTGLSFSGATIRSFVADYQIYRNTTSTGATELSESGILIGTYSTVSATWEMQQAPVVGDAGVTLSITALGQVQYVSSNITGTPASSVMKFKARTMGV